MTIRVRSPLADVNAAPPGETVRVPPSLEGRRMGFLWSQHASSVKFWPWKIRTAYLSMPA